MSSPFKNRFKNFFLSKNISREAMKQLAGDHLDALEAPKQPAKAPDTAAMAAELRPLYDAFQAGLGTGAAGVAQKQGATTVQDTAFTTLTAYPARAARQFIMPKFEENSAPYEEFFPQGRAAFTTASHKNIGTRMKAFIIAAKKYQGEIGAEVATTAQALLTAFEQAGAAQGKADKATKDSSQAIRADQQALAVLLFAHYGTLIAAFAENPEQAEAYFNFSILPSNKKKPPVA